MTDSVGLGANGGALTDWDHVKQSVRDVLTTPIGSRVMRRPYGSELPFLIDNPINEETKLRMIMAAADAMERWEPRFRVQRVVVEEASPGHMGVVLYGVYFPRGHLRDFTYAEDGIREIRL